MYINPNPHFGLLEVVEQLSLRVALCCSLFQYCVVLQCVAVRCSVL